MASQSKAAKSNAGVLLLVALARWLQLALPLALPLALRWLFFSTSSDSVQLSLHSSTNVWLVHQRSTFDRLVFHHPSSLLVWLGDA
jgi:hypothetical protein